MSDTIDISERGYIRKRFTVVIPARIRKRLHLKENEPIKIALKGNKIILTAIRENPFDKLTRYGSGIKYNREARLQAGTSILNLLTAKKDDVD